MKGENKMQAIVTKYIPPTDTKPARIKATAVAGSITVPYSYKLDGEEAPHRVAAQALREKLGWAAPEYGDLIAAELPNNAGYCWVFDMGRLQAMRDMINSMRKATWQGAPWGKDEFKRCVYMVGRTLGYVGSVYETPTTDAEIAAFKASREG